MKKQRTFSPIGNMSPITHFLISWAVAEQVTGNTRDRRVITLCGVAADLDGIGVVVDFVSPVLGGPVTGLYQQYHHALFHGLFGVALIGAGAAVLADRRASAGLWAVVVVHLHFLCDVVGSRGTTSEDIWPIPYLAPFSDALTLVWSGQWALNAWPNLAITLLLLVLGFVYAVRYGRSPVGIISRTADRAFVETVKNRWQQLTKQRGSV